MPLPATPAPDDIAAYLEQHAIRVTPARLAIMLALVGADQALSVEAIHRQLTAAGHQFSLAGNYRAVEAFETAGIAIRSWEDAGSRRMLYSRAPEQAALLVHRFACRSCGRIIDVADTLFSQQLHYQAVRLGLRRRAGRHADPGRMQPVRGPPARGGRAH